MIFDWDKNKNRINQKKHKVSFEEAKTVFYDEDALLIPDFGHSNCETRFILLGLSHTIKELVVSYCERTNENGNEVIRIISARKADPDERNDYWRRKGI